MKENNRKSTFASTLRSTAILEIIPVSILGSYFGVSPFSTSLPGQEVSYHRKEGNFSCELPCLPFLDFLE